MPDDKSLASQNFYSFNTFLKLAESSMKDILKSYSVNNYRMHDMYERYKRILAACQTECGLEVSDNKHLCFKCPKNNEMFAARSVYEEKEMPRLCPLRNDDDKLASYRLVGNDAGGRTPRPDEQASLFTV